MKQSSKRLLSMFLSLFFVVASLLVFFDLIQPSFGTVSALKGQVIAQRDFLESEKKAVEKAQQLITQMQAQSQGTQNVGLALPTTLDMAGALAQIYGLADNNGVIVQSISVSAPVLLASQAPVRTGTQDAGSATKPAAPASISKPVGTFTLQVAALGSYENVRAFVGGLETNVRIFDVKSFSVSPSLALGGAKGQNNANFFNYAVAVGTYYQTQ